MGKNPQVTPLPYTVPILYCCLSILISKLMFQGLSPCVPTVSLLYFSPFNPYHFSLLPFYLPPPNFSVAFNTYPYILYLHRCYVLWYLWCSIMLVSFPSFPEFHRVAPILQICSTYEFVCDHVCFCVYVYLLAFSSMYERKLVASVFLSLA
jgi:hypothetical protein